MPAPSPGRGSRWATVGLLAALPLLLTWPLARLATTHVMAAPDQEAAPHIWGLWAAGRTGSLLRLETTLQAWPEGVGLVLVDPAHVPLFHLGALVSPALGYNLVVWAGVVLMGLAGALLAAEAGGRPLVGAVVGMACPTLLANAADGMTEGFGVGLVGVFLALCLRAARTGDRRAVVAAGLALGATAWTGPYNAIWAATLGCGVGGGAILRRRWPAVRSTLAVGGIGLLLSIPVGLAIFRARDEGLPGGSDRAGLPDIVERPEIFRGGVQTGADLLDLWLPVQLTGGQAEVSHTAYLGLAVLGAAGVACVRAPRARPWVGGALVFALLALGPWLYLGGSVLRLGDAPLAGPAGLLMLAVPVLGRVTRWYRAGAIATLLLAPAVSLAASSRRGAGLLAVLCVVDVLACAPMAWPLHASALPEVAPLARLPDPGALLELPPVTSGPPPPGAWRDLTVLSQVVHGRPVGGSMMGLGVSDAARSGVEAVRGLLRSGTLPADRHAVLRDHGFRYLVVHLQHHELPPRSRDHLAACLGPPVVASAALLVHDLGAAGAPAGCTPTDTSLPTPAGRFDRPTGAH